MGKVLVAVSGGEGGTPVLTLLRSMEPRPDEVVLVHVRRLSGSPVSAMHDDGSPARRAKGVLARYQREIEIRDRMRVRAFVRNGTPSDEILKTAREERVDLIILGGGRRMNLSSMMTGSTVKEVEKRATVPVLVATAAGRNTSMEEGEAYAA